MRYIDGISASEKKDKFVLFSEPKNVLLSVGVGLLFK